MSQRKVKVINVDEETEKIIKELHERGYNISALMRKLIKEFYEREVKKHE